MSGPVIACALGAGLLAQQIPDRAATPPLLSTNPTPPAGVTPQPSQMSGLPLQVGDLPPGTVVVRVVRRSFSNNVINHPVELQVLTGNGRLLQIVTDPAGRAMFGGLKIGDTVMARSTVDGELLESQRFELPAQGGVRVALVSGIGAGQARSAAPSPGAAVLPAAPQARQALSARSLPWWIISAVFAVLGIGVLAAGVRQYRRGLRNNAADRNLSFERLPALERRELLFQMLVQLEEAHAARRVNDRDYQARRGTLIDQLVAIDSAGQQG